MKRTSTLIVLLLSVPGMILGQTTLISPSGDGGFENGSTFPANGWTVVNHTTNIWAIGTATSNGGVNGAYVSNDAGASNAYTITTSQVSHFYRDVTFPSGETAITLSFDWKGFGESTYDYLRVFLVPTTTTPVAGTQLTTGQLGLTYYNQQTSYTSESITIPGSAAGTTQRLVFSWRNDNSAGTQPPAAIDNISLISFTPVPMTGTYTIDPNGSGSNNFTTFAAAVSSLNLNGPGTGGVTFLVADGATFNETEITITATGTSSNPIIFQQSGAGTKPVINFTGTALGTNACFKLDRCDYLTFNGLDIRDAGTASSDYVEFGFYLAGSSSDGCQNNTIRNCIIDLTKSNTNSRGVYLYSLASSSGTTNANNKFYNNTIREAYNGYYFYGSISYPDNGNEVNTEGGGSSVITDIGNNLVSTVYGIYIAYQTNLTIANTTISNLTAATAMFGIYENLGSSNTVTYHSNDIHSITGTSTSSAIYGINITAGSAHNIYLNKIHNITAAYSVFGLHVSSGSTNNIYKNKIYSVHYTGTSSYIAYGMAITGGTTNNVYNNFISDIKAPGSTGTPGVRALNLSGGTTNNIFNNSVLVDYVSTSTSNQSAALYVTAGPSTVDLRNNIFINKANVATGMRAVAFYKTTTSLTNIGANTNNNLYYAGTPGTKNLIFYDGTNSDQTLIAYQARVSPRDALAVTEDAPFQSLTDLHIDPDVITFIESGGARITTPVAVADDIDGDIRQGETGYMGTGSAPDIGADEGEFTALSLLPPTGFSAAPYSSTANQITFTPTGDPVNNVVIVWNNLGTFDAPSGAPPAVGEPFAGGTLLYNGTTSPVTHTGLTFGVTYYYSAWSIDGTNNYSTGVNTQTAPAVPAPLSLTATGISPTQIDLSWTQNASGHNVIIAYNSSNSFGQPANGTTYSTGNSLPTAGTVIYNGPATAFSHTALNWGTIYYYKAWSVDAATIYSTTGIMANDTTFCDIYALPYEQDFEASQFPPPCWSRLTGFLASPSTLLPSTLNWYQDDWRNVTSPVDRAAKINVWSTAVKHWLVTPAVDLGTGAYQLEFELTLNEYGTSSPPETTGTDDKFAVVISTDGGTTWTAANTLRLWDNAGSPYVYNNINPNGEKIILDLSAYSGVVKIGFYAESTVENADNDLMVNNVIIQTPPSCPQPYALNTSGINSHSAVLEWTPVGNETLWEVIYGPTGFDPNTSGTLIQGISAHPYTLDPPLNPSTSYDWYVRTDCGAARETSAWAGPGNFTTLCAPYSIPWAEGFESLSEVGSGIIPECMLEIGDWTTHNESATYNRSPHSGTNYIYTYYSADDWLITGGFNLTGGQTYAFSFWYIMDGATPWTIETKYGAFQSVNAMTESFGAALVNPINTTYQQYTAYLTPAVSGEYYIGIHVTATFDPDFCSFDDLELALPPSCPAPIDLITENITATAADLNWTQIGDAATWDIIYGAEGFDPATEGTLISGVTAKPYTLNLLNPVTTYDWYVRADCGASREFSDWSAKASFTTSLCDPEDQCAYTFNLIDTYGDGWNGASMQVLQNGSVVATLGTGFTDGETDQEIVMLCDGIDFSVFWSNGGSWPAECGLEILDAFLNQLYYQVPVGSGNVGEVLYTGTVMCALPACPAPTSLQASDITGSSATLDWESWPDSFFDVFYMPVGGDPEEDGTRLFGVPEPPLVISGLEPSTEYSWNVRTDCGFETPKVDNFWMAMPTLGGLDPALSGGTIDEPEQGENGTWYLYPNAPGGRQWWNIWFYNDPPDTTRIKKIRMGFWINTYNPLNPGTLYYVINWSDSSWQGTGFPLPANEAFVRRSPTNGPLDISPNTPQWVELYFIVPEYNPEWVSVDLWGENIIIEQVPASPPAGSPLLTYWLPGMPGGLIVHECLPKESMSDWGGPATFTTACGAFPIPYVQNFDGVTAPQIPLCMTVNDHNSDAVTWKTSASYPKSSPNSMYVGYNSTLPMNDWFFTPALSMTPGNYWVSFWYRGSGITFPEKLEVKWGSAPSAAGMTNGPVFDNNYITNATYAEGTGTITVTSAGDYYVGWHGYSNANMFYLVVDDIRVQALYYWTGLGSSASWFDAGNWDRGAVPDATCIAIIPSSHPGPLLPEVPAGTATCFGLRIETGKTVNVLPGARLEVLNP